MKRKIQGKADLVAWAQAYVDQGLQPHEACRTAFDEAIKEKRAAAVLRALGWRYAFYEVWMEANRFDQLRPTAEEDVEPTPITPRAPTGAPSERRVDAAAVRVQESLYSKLVSVGRHKWVPIGDLTKAMCKTVAAAYRVRAQSNEYVAEIFDALDNGLEDGQTTIRQRFSEVELEALWQRKAA